jgi:hypothetical protein
VRSALFANDLDQHALAAPSVELAIKDLLPRTEVEFTRRDCDHNLPLHDLAFLKLAFLGRGRRRLRAWGLAPHEPVSNYHHNRTGEDNADAHMKRTISLSMHSDAAIDPIDDSIFWVYSPFAFGNSARCQDNDWATGVAAVQFVGGAAVAQSGTVNDSGKLPEHLFPFSTSAGQPYPPPTRKVPVNVTGTGKTHLAIAIARRSAAFAVEPRCCGTGPARLPRHAFNGGR